MIMTMLLPVRALYVEDDVAAREGTFYYYYYYSESTVQGRERVRTFYLSKDPNPIQPTHGRKKKIK